MSFIKSQAAEEMETHTSVEEIIRNTFAINEENDSAMKLLSIGGMSKAVSFFTEKDDKKSLQTMIQQQVKKTVEKANALEVDNKVRAHHTLSRILLNSKYTKKNSRNSIYLFTFLKSKMF